MKKAPKAEIDVAPKDSPARPERLKMKLSRNSESKDDTPVIRQPKVRFKSALTSVCEVTNKLSASVSKWLQLKRNEAKSAKRIFALKIEI